MTAPTAPAGVFAVQCPNSRCRKYMLVEDHDRGNVVSCLLCKTPIRIGGAPAPPKDAAMPRRPDPLGTS